MIFKKYRQLESAYFKGDKRSLEYIAAYSLFTSISYRLGKNAIRDRLLFFRIVKEALSKSFKKIPFKRITETSQLAVLDNSFNFIEVRKRYIKKMTGDDIKLLFNKSELLGYSSLINVVKTFIYLFYLFVRYPFILKKGINKVNYALIIKEIPEIMNFVALVSKENINTVFDFANYEVDSNFLYLILKTKGITVYKVPSSGPLYMHNKNILADTLVISSGYQREETIVLKDTVRADKIINFFPELSKLSFDKKVEISDDALKTIGFYSHASWIRSNEKDTDNGLNLREAEEILIKNINEVFVNSRYSLMIFLHPREKKKFEETKKYYDRFLYNVHYQFAPLDRKSTECFHLCNIALVTLSNMLFERIFEGYKILISKEGIIGFPNPDSFLNNICFSNSIELSKLLEENLGITYHDFFEKYKLSDYMSEKFISDEYK